MELKNTIELMNSKDYENRFKAEYYQLKIRRDRLHNMLEKYSNGTLGFVPSCPIELLQEQEEVMNNYLWILEERANIEQVELVES